MNRDGSARADTTSDPGHAWPAGQSPA